ncbi:unnamed protein product [Anisakis simplex]|uniref:PEST proteolytic signal-containing nuclear protein n=1 Tax=Anisakis simplex TaxID=6269 RepID=A0A0M3K889_ANISI|nr:unnamed protein product [Anisakis simplex]
MTGVFFVCLRSFRKFRSGTFSNGKINGQASGTNQEKDSNKRGDNNNVPKPPKTLFNKAGGTVRNGFENVKGTNQAGSRKDRDQTASWQTKGKGQATFESARNRIQNTAEKPMHNTMRNGKNEKMLPWERYVQVQFGSAVQQAAKFSNDLSKPSNGHWERPKVQSRGTVQEPAKPPKNLFESNNGHREKSKVQHRGVVEESAENDMDDEEGPGLMTGLFD